MEIKDRIYDKIVIKEPVLIELINSKPLQRLKGINQYGALQYIIKDKDVTRYEHCVGVMMLLKKLGASVEEQIAGLLHDVPHTAFSHVIDFVFRTEEHNYHEKFHEKVVMNSDIPCILKKYGFDVNKVICEGNFLLLERPLPNLCADRVDYTLRELWLYRAAERVKLYLKHIIVKNNEIMFDDEEIAQRFAEDYLKMDTERWAGPREVALFQILADAIKIGLENGIITEDDLFKDDEFVYNKLKNSGKREILEKLKLLNPNFKVVEDPQNYNFHSWAKLRYIDPKFVDKGYVKRITDISPEFKERIERHKQNSQKGSYIRIVSW